MKKTSLILGSIELMLGLLLLAATGILGELIPKFGRMAFVLAGPGSYSPAEYVMNLFLPYAAAAALLLLGLFTILYFSRKPKEK